MHFAFAAGKGVGQRVEHLLRERIGGVRVINGHAELVATQAGQQRALARLGTDALRCHVQHVVAHVVAHRLVHGLEVVQPDIQQRGFP
eukprot:11055-Eustigmatos_ZCMA.PRE.1